MATVTQTENNYGVASVTDAYYAQLEEIKNNPARIIEYVYSHLSDVTNGKVDVPNPSHPFGYLMETSAMLAGSLHRTNEAIYRRQYPYLATTYEELYNHMFDEHYIGRFAKPGHAKIYIHLPLESLLSKLVETDIEGVRQLILPRGSIISVGDYVFTLLYPIIIKQLPHKGLQILYDTTSKDPVQTLSSNIIDWAYVTYEGVEYLRIKPDMLNITLQMGNEDTLVAANGYDEIFEFKHKFCHCRVYHLTTNGWVEMSTTHSDVIYDQYKLTARITYLENKIRVQIPSIYFNKKMTGSKVRVEIYTTLGDVEEYIGEYNPENYHYQWGQLEDTTLDTKYVANLALVDDPIIYGQGLLTGGKEPESFEETRERVVNFAHYTQQPITHNQLATTLKLKNYNLVKARDVITSRSYLAVRSLPLNKWDTFNAGAASSMERVKVKLDALVKHPATRDNNLRITITPEMLYRNRDGVVTPVYPEDIPNIKTLGNDKFLTEVNSLEYCYSPFYYVVDTSNDTTDMRAYYFDDPKAENITFIANNSSSGYNVSTDDIIIERFKDTTGEGFMIRIVTRSTDEYKEVPVENLFCQLGIQPVKENKFAYINGTCLGFFETNDSGQKNAVFEFKIHTRWDVTAKDYFVIEKFYMAINEPRKFEVGLESDVHFIYGIKGQNIVSHEPDQVDKLINKEIIDDDQLVGITHDKVTCKFGDRLKNFWSNAIALQDTLKYERYTADVPRVYRDNVYRVGKDGLLELDKNNNLIIQHRAGDPVLDEKGNPIYLARKGDVKIDANGKPIKAEDRTMYRILDIMMMDGIYYFATDENDKKYKSIVSATVKDWVTQDLEEISERLLENTDLYFYPKRTMGDSKLVVDGGMEIQTGMRLSFDVVYYMTEESYGNQELRTAISQMTSDQINEILTRKTVSRSDIVTILKEQAGDTVKAVKVVINGPRTDMSIFTSENDGTRCSVKRVLRQLADKTLKVVEDIDVSFVKHDTSSLM